jgi:pyruvate,water dikinase
LKQVRNDPRFAPRRTNPWSILRAAATFLRRTRLPLAATRYLLRPRRAVRTVNRLIRELDGLALVSPYNHLAAAERGLRGLPGILVTILPVMLSGLGVFLLARRLLEGRATEDELQVALRGLPHNPTTEMDLVLWEMATRVHKDESSRAALAEIDASELSRQYLASKLPPLLQSELSDFLTRYGHRGIAEIDIGVPRWSEDPAHILGTLANYLRLDRADVAPHAQFAGAAREAEDMVSLLQTRASGLRGVLVGCCCGALGRWPAIEKCPSSWLCWDLAMRDATCCRLGPASPDKAASNKPKTCSS